MLDEGFVMKRRAREKGNMLQPQDFLLKPGKVSPDGSNGAPYAGASPGLGHGVPLSPGLLRQRRPKGDQLSLYQCISLRCQAAHLSTG